MKKVLVILMSMMFVSLSTFALGGVDEFLYVGADWGFATEIAKDETFGTVKTQLDSFNFNFGCDSYFNEHVGIAIDCAFGFGNINKVTVDYGNGTIIGINKDNIDKSLFLSALLGVALKYDISPNFQVFSNIGAHGGIYGANIKVAYFTAFSLGVGANLGARFVYNRFFFQSGIGLNHDFLVDGENGTPYETEKISGLYNYTIFQPFVDIGIRI